ncbi:exosome complex component MTR3 isoform X2 [Kryptolebias marmoratus]|uniref:exosome complex component MTR3 isoform X2 n=1 Tax=Kryptolebias marmoratus TaxID=37003 RepID=UPI000D530072|nr:exosome complex component MTR3 isoform X2 [Kryptolebias marmoratus]
MGTSFRGGHFSTPSCRLIRSVFAALKCLRARFCLGAGRLRFFPRTAPERTVGSGTRRTSGRFLCAAAWLTTDMRLAPFSCPVRGSWIQGTQDKDLSLMLYESLQPAVCLQKYPRSQIEVSVMVLENSGSVLAHAVTCASLALADAGIEMYDLVLGCSLCQDAGSYVVDPTYAEETSCGSGGGLTVAFLPSLNQISGLQSDGEMSEETLTAGVRTCIEGCYKLYPVIQQALIQALRRAAPPPSES